VKLVKTKLENSKVTMDMSELFETYSNLYFSHGSQDDLDEKLTKTTIRNLIEKEIENIVFVSPQQKNKPDILLTLESISKKFTCIESASSSRENLIQSARYLRKTVIESPVWTFEGTFENFEVPEPVSLFFRNALAGCDKMKNLNREKQLNRDVNILSQILIATCRTDRQVLYEPKDEVNHFSACRETPLSVGISLFLHMQSRSKIEIEFITSLNLGINYKKVLDIENALADSVCKYSDETGEYCVPSWVVKGIYPYFGAENIDFQEQVIAGKYYFTKIKCKKIIGTFSLKFQNKTLKNFLETFFLKLILMSYHVKYLFLGGSTLHGTILVLFQQKSDNPKEILHFDRDISNCKVNSKLTCNYLERAKPDPKKYSSHYQHPQTNLEMEKARKIDLLWATNNIKLSEDTNSEEKQTSMTWGAFNSLFTNKVNQVNVGTIAPLLRDSPTEYPVFYSMIMRAKSINDMIMGQNFKTVMSFDLQLYDMAMKLWCSDEDIKSKFLFRPGELHTSFWSLQSLGRYIAGSGLDQAWIETG
jgi:hypothetical protein